MQPATPTYRWENVTMQAPFAGRDGAGALVLHNRMWLLGGWNPSDPLLFPRDCNNEVWSSSDGLDWRLVRRTAPWEPRHCAGTAVFQNQMWIVGGDAVRGRYQGDIWRSPDGDQWTCVEAHAPWSPRCLHYTVVHDGRLWVMGGQTVPSCAPTRQRYYNDVWCSSNGNDWECVQPDAPWTARGQIGGTAVKDGFIWLIGGARYQEHDYAEVWRSADGIAWESVSTSTPWEARNFHDVAVFDGHLWILGGYTQPSGNRNDVWHSPDGIDWTEIPDTPWAPRHASSVYVHAGSLWIVAGNNMFPDVWRLQRDP